MCLAEIFETPFSQSRVRSKTYCGQKVKKITEALRHTVIIGAPIDDGTEMFQQLKEKFQETKRRSEQVQVLIVLPKSWSVKKVGVSEYLARQSKKLVKVSFSSWSIMRTFTATSNSYRCSMNLMTSVV